MTDVSRYLVSHQVGQKQYELTNHLGNVQATISDLPVLQGPENEVTRRAPALASVYDYYPFGMLMPGRYASDTTGKCMTISQTKWVTTWVDSCYKVPLLATTTFGGATKSISGDLLNINAPSANSGISFELNLVPDVEQDLTFDFTDILSGSAYINISEQVNGVWVNIGSVTATMKGTVLVRVKPRINISRVDILGPCEVATKTVCVKRPVMIQQTMLVDVCNGVKDRYRFGFNGQEKVNEWAGIGNFMEFSERGYDSRIARFLALDPDRKKYPSLSPYAFAANTPIQAIDEEGKGPTYSSLRFLAKQSNALVGVAGNIGLSYGATLSAAKGMAVDPNGNVALFYTGSLPTVDYAGLIKGHLTPGASLTASFTYWPGREVTDVSGASISIGVSGGINGVVGGINGDVAIGGKIKPLGVTVSVGIGTPGVSINYGLNITFATLYSEKDFKKIDKNWDEIGRNTAIDWDRGINDNMGNPSGFWNYTGTEEVYKPVAGKKGVYEVEMIQTFEYRPSGKGAREGQKNQKVSKTIPTGVQMQKTDNYTLKSINLRS